MPAGVTEASYSGAVCELEGGGTPEIVFANGNVNDTLFQTHRAFQNGGPGCVDEDVALGLNFTVDGNVADDTAEGRVSEEFACGGLDGDGLVDVVAVGDTTDCVLCSSTSGSDPALGAGLTLSRHRR